MNFVVKTIVLCGCDLPCLANLALAAVTDQCYIQCEQRVGAVTNVHRAAAVRVSSDCGPGKMIFVKELSNSFSDRHISEFHGLSFAMLHSPSEHNKSPHFNLKYYYIIIYLFIKVLQGNYFSIILYGILSPKCSTPLTLNRRCMCFAYNFFYILFNFLPILSI